MDRVIPKDILDLIYKEAHIDKIKRLNAEYHELFDDDGRTLNDDKCYVRNKNNQFNYGYRELDYFDYNSVFTFRNNHVVNIADLPKRYFYSSGHTELKWIE